MKKYIVIVDDSISLDEIDTMIELGSLDYDEFKYEISEVIESDDTQSSPVDMSELVDTICNVFGVYPQTASRRVEALKAVLSKL